MSDAFSLESLAAMTQKLLSNPPGREMKYVWWSKHMYSRVEELAKERGYKDGVFEAMGDAVAFKDFKPIRWMGFPIVVGKELDDGAA